MVMLRWLCVCVGLVLCECDYDGKRAAIVSSLIAIRLVFECECDCVGGCDLIAMCRIVIAIMSAIVNVLMSGVCVV